MATHCKGCHHIVDQHAPVEGVRKPKEGDYSICFYCGKISTFDKEQNLVPITDEELSVMKNDDYGNYSILQNAAILIQERIDKN